MKIALASVIVLLSGVVGYRVLNEQCPLTGKCLVDTSADTVLVTKPMSESGCCAGMGHDVDEMGDPIEPTPEIATETPQGDDGTVADHDIRESDDVDNELSMAE